MTKNVDMNSQFDRMKQLMKYGLNEGVKQPYSGIEYSKVAADGKLYGIVREGTKFYIKVGTKSDNLMVENFNYIGGFRNRKDNEYSSFANAQKNFDFKMKSIAEARNADNVIFESWNLEKNGELAVEATDKMKKEIQRNRQIMENAMKISKGQPQSQIKPMNEAKSNTNDPFTEKPGKEYTDNENDNIKGEPGKTGDAKKANGYKDADLKKTDLLTCGGKKCKCGDKNCTCDKNDVNEAEVLGWNRGNDEYMDKSHGTKIGDSAPFDDAKGRDIDDAQGTSKTSAMKDGTIEEGASMHDADNQNTPKPGVGEIGDNEPFDGEKGRQIDEAIDDLDTDVDLEDGDELDGDMGLEDDGEFIDDEDNEMDDLDDTEYELDMEEDGLEDRVAAMEDLLGRIADKMGVGDYSDDDLYDGEDDEFGDDDVDDFGDEGFDDTEDDFEDEEDDTEVYESKSYRAMKLQEARRRMVMEDGMQSFKDAGRVPSGNMNKLNDFGKHPAYQKKVMSLPPKDMQEFPGYYDMNDASVYNDSPYGEKIGSGAPFEFAPEKVDNAISESISRFLKKKR